MQEDHTTKQMLEQFVDLAGKKVHVEKRSLVGPQIEAFAAAVRQDDVHVLAISVSAALRIICHEQCHTARPLGGMHDHTLWVCTISLPSWQKTASCLSAFTHNRLRPGVDQPAL